MNPEKWAQIIEDKEREAGADVPVLSATCTISGIRGDGVADLAERGETLLSRFSSFVPGSFQVDAATKTLVFQCRGDSRQARAMGFFLGTSTKTFVRLKE